MLIENQEAWMKRTIRLETDLSVDQDGNVQVEATNLKMLISTGPEDSDQATATPIAA